MAHSHTLSALLLAIACLVQNNSIGFSSAFRSHDARPHNTASEDKTSSTITLNFAGETVMYSDSAAVNNKKSLHDFFSLPHVAPLILRGSKNNQVNELEDIDAKLLKQYELACEKFNILPPSPNDRIFEVKATGFKLPGVQVISTAIIGVKIISTTQDLPGYELVVIRDETHVKGMLFNRVTGKDKSKDDQTTFSVNRINVVPEENGMISFESNANLSLLVPCPSFLMNSKERIEKKGGESIQKTLEDDISVALKEFRQEYVRWLDGSLPRNISKKLVVISSRRQWRKIFHPLCFAKSMVGGRVKSMLLSSLGLFV